MATAGAWERAAVKIESFLAVREESGFFIWSSLVRVDRDIRWSLVEVAGRSPHCTIEVAQYRGAIRVLKQLRALQPESSMTFVTDSQRLIQELGSQCLQVRRTSADLDAAIDLVRGLGDDLALRHCSRRENLVAHAMISLLCKRYGVHVRERYVQQ